MSEEVLFDATSTMVASAVAGMFSRIFMHPIDTCKARMQVQPLEKSFLKVGRETFANEGVRGIYAGFRMAFLGSAPATCLYLTSYESSKAFLNSTELGQRSPFMANFSSGFIAEAFSCVLWVPIDVVKERMQVQTLSATGTLYRGPIQALLRVHREEGFRGIYRGYGATLASFGPFSALYLSIYDQLKLMAQNTSLSAGKSNKELPFPAYVAIGATAGATASWLTSPLDLVKLRLQVDRAKWAQGHKASFGFNYSNVMHGFACVWREGGVRALWKGAMARVAFSAPSAAITISAFEWIKIQLTRSSKNRTSIH